MKIIFVFDYCAELNDLGDEILRAMDWVMCLGWLILGFEVECFERVFFDYLGGGYGIGVVNGTDAITAALMVFGVGLGDEVITVVNTVTVMVNVIVWSGVIFVFCDVDLQMAFIDVN